MQGSHQGKLFYEGPLSAHLIAAAKPRLGQVSTSCMKATSNLGKKWDWNGVSLCPLYYLLLRLPPKFHLDDIKRTDARQIADISLHKGLDVITIPYGVARTCGQALLDNRRTPSVQPTPLPNGHNDDW